MVKLELIPGKYDLPDENFASTAERLMKGYLEKPEGGKLTTSKLRGIYAMVMNV